jgi:penicillin-binding protein 2
MLGSAQATLMTALMGRMFYLQVIESDKYTSMSEKNSVNNQLLQPERGRILDRNGIPLAINQENFRAVLIVETIDDVEEALDSIGQIINLSERDKNRIMHDAKKARKFGPVVIRDYLSWEEVSRIEINLPDLPNVLIDVGQTRYYPLVRLGAHLLGYVSAVTENDIQNSSDRLLELPGFRIGKAGIERVYDSALRGKGGTRQIIVNAVGKNIRELSRIPGERGTDISLTIDIDLQKLAAQRLKQESGSVIVMDIHSGEIIVMASSPSFDPNAFNRGLTSEEWKELSTDQKSPLTNKAISGQYPPGSTFKTIVALAALESGLITKDHSVDCQGRMTLGNFTWYCDKRHGVLDMKAAIERSCDVYFYDVAHRIGIDTIADMAKKFGLGSKLDIGLPAENSGLVPNRSWKKETLGVPWTPGEDFNAGIGQGYLQVTPLQLVVLAARLANRGLGVLPRLIKDDNSDRQNRDFPSLGISASSLSTVLEGMIRVTMEPSGTAYASRITHPAFAMAGKTGTAQVHHLSLTEHHLEKATKPEDRAWKLRDHALFIGFAPIVEPRYACAVVIEHGGWGASAAAPVAKDVLLAVQQHYLTPFNKEGERS